MNIEVNLSKQEAQALIQAAQQLDVTPDELAERQIRRFLGELKEAEIFSIAEEKLSKDGTVKYVMVETEDEAVMVLEYDISEGQCGEQAHRQAVDFIKSLPADGTAVESPLEKNVRYRLSTLKERLNHREEKIREDIQAESIAQMFSFSHGNMSKLFRERAEEIAQSDKTSDAE